MILGYFVVPLVAPKDLHGIRVHAAKDGCVVEFSTATTYLWHENPAMGDLSGELKCNESMSLLPNVVIACVCP